MGFQQKLKLVSVNTYPRKIYMKKSNGLQQKLKFVSTNKKKKLPASVELLVYHPEMPP